MKAPSPPPGDERWTANCWDEKRWHRQWHSSFLHLENHSVMSGGITDTPYQAWCNFCIRARGRENRHESRSQVQPGTPVIQFYYCLQKTEEDAPMITVLVAVDTVYKQMVAIPFFEKKGNRDPFASRSLAAFARHVGHPKVIIQGDSERALIAVVHGACALLTSATPRISSVISKGSNGAAKRAGSPIR